MEQSRVMASKVPHVPWFFWVLCPRPGNAAGSTLPCRASVAASRALDPGSPQFVTRWSPLLGSTPTEVPPRCLHQSCISLKKKINILNRIWRKTSKMEIEAEAQTRERMGPKFGWSWVSGPDSEPRSLVSQPGALPVLPVSSCAQVTAWA